MKTLEEIFEETTSASLGHGASDGSAIKPSGKFAGADYFDCDPDTFAKSFNSRKKGEHWFSKLGKSDFTKSVRDYARKNKKSAIMLRNTQNGTYLYAQRASE